MSETDYAPPMPEAVRRQKERAEQLVAEQRAARDGPEITTTVGEPDEPIVATNPEPEVQLTPEPGTPNQQPTGAPEPEPKPDDWQQRYLTLQGKYSREVPELSGQLRELRGQMSQMQGLLAAVRDQKVAPAPVVRAAPVIPKEDIESYGADLVEASRRWARAEFSDEITQLRGQVDQINTRSQQIQTTVQQRTVEQTLDHEVADWRNINNDDAFITWLDQVDPFSRVRRHDMLNDAYQSGDGPRTAAFFRAFSTEQTAVSPSPAAPTHTPNGAGRVPLEDLAAPGRGNPTASSQGAPQKRNWTQPQIAAFYRDVQRGRYETREVERVRTEQDIFTAQNEGRIR